MFWWKFWMQLEVKVKLTFLKNPDSWIGSQIGSNVKSSKQFEYWSNFSPFLHAKFEMQMEILHHTVDAKWFLAPTVGRQNYLPISVGAPKTMLYPRGPHSQPASPRGNPHPSGSHIFGSGHTVGKIVIAHFWPYFCAPCQKQFWIGIFEPLKFEIFMLWHNRLVWLWQTERTKTSKTDKTSWFMHYSRQKCNFKKIIKIDIFWKCLIQNKF